MKLGLVTYNMAHDWSLTKIIEKCEAHNYEAVELRTTHAHGVEISLTKVQRQEVRRQFEGSRVRLLSLGTACEYHSNDPAVVRANIEETKEFLKLGKDLGCLGVKVRPNGLQLDAGIPREKTLEQIGVALKECGDFAAKTGVEVWLEVHGSITCEPSNIHSIMEIADHPSVGLCWNSNQPDIVNGSVLESFNLLKKWLRAVHINDLDNPCYPWRELFALLRSIDYDRYCLAEIAWSSDPDYVMRYYRALWKELTR